MIIWSLSGERLGKAKLLYVDSRTDDEEARLKTSARKLAQQTADLAISLRVDRPDQREIGETQYSEIFGTFFVPAFLLLFRFFVFVFFVLFFLLF